MIKLIEKGDGVDLSLRVQPNAKKEEICGVTDGALKIKVTAPPREGEANEACIRLLSKTLKIPRGKISIRGGSKSRLKRIRIAGVKPKELQSLLKPYLREP